MHILHTVLYTFPQVLTRRICLPIKRFLHWWSFPIVRSGKEKMCNKFKKINNTFWKNVSTVLLSSSVQVCTKYKKNVKYILRKCWLNKTNNSSRRMYAEHRMQRELCIFENVRVPITDQVLLHTWINAEGFHLLPQLFNLKSKKLFRLHH